jgi:AraC-like DNA-binding protein
MDVLADVLAAFRRGPAVAAQTIGHAPWGLRFAQPVGMVFHIALRGHSRLLLPEAEPLALGPGDVVLLTEPPPHILCDDPASAVVDFSPEMEDHTGVIGRLVIPGPGPEASLLCGAYLLREHRAPPLLSALPRVIPLPAGVGGSSPLRNAVDLLADEVHRGQAGASAVISALVDALWVYLLRSAVAQDRPGLGVALADPAVAAALKAIHGEPHFPWTVEGLAAEGGFARAAFARRFHDRVGEPPLTYLTRWRMDLAARYLREGEEPLRAVAREVGYHSEYAFAKAFKRAHGTAPGTYRRTIRAE